jgi:hypothetical protein
LMLKVLLTIEIISIKGYLVGQILR